MMKALRIALSALFGSFLLVGTGGALYWVVGEWDARRRLPSEMRTPEAIHKLYDDAVCLECGLGGGLIIVTSIWLGACVLFIWALIEVLNFVAGSRKRQGKGWGHRAA